MKKLLLASAVAAALTAPTVQVAHAADAAPASPHTFTGNVGFASDYRFRGIAQTFKGPALQGGFDYSHASGLYVGTWASNVYGGNTSATPATGGPVYAGGSMEWDIYGGYKWEAAKDLTLDVGVLYYMYPGAKWVVASRDKYNNTELYLGASYKWFSAKYSRTISDFFGTNTATNGGFCGINLTTGVALAAATATDGCFGATPGGSKGSGYLDLNATFEIADKTNLLLHYGHQSVKNYSLYSYSDYKVGVTTEAVGLTWGLAYVGTNAKKSFYAVGETDGAGATKVKKTGDGTLLLTVSKTF